jgi:hypothetical protein
MWLAARLWKALGRSYRMLTQHRSSRPAKRVSRSSTTSIRPAIRQQVGCLTRVISNWRRKKLSRLSKAAFSTFRASKWQMPHLGFIMCKLSIHMRDVPPKSPTRREMLCPAFISSFRGLLPAATICAFVTSSLELARRSGKGSVPSPSPCASSSLKAAVRLTRRMVEKSFVYDAPFMNRATAPMLTERTENAMAIP